MEDPKRFEKLKLYVTGFGAFGNVLTNPTSILVSKITENKTLLEEVLNIEIVSTDVLKVTMSEAEKYCDNIHNQLSSNMDKNTMHLVIHFGVAAKSTKIHLETIAKNRFKGTDVDGVTKEGCINENCNEAYLSRLDLNMICTMLRSSKYENFLDLSNDAGSYLCNFIYFCSESRCKSENYDNVFCQFVHVPLFENINEEIQYNFFIDFITIIKEIYIK